MMAVRAVRLHKQIGKLGSKLLVCGPEDRLNMGRYFDQQS